MASGEAAIGSRLWSGAKYADWKIYTSPALATALFPIELAREAVAPLREKFDSENEAFGEEIWPELARACVAFVRVRLDALVPLDFDSSPRAPTVLQLLGKIRKASDELVEAADELRRQALEPRERGEEPDRLRLYVLERLSYALCVEHLPAGLRERMQSQVGAGELISALRPPSEDSGLAPLKHLRDEARTIYTEARSAKKKVAGKSKGRRSDPNMRALIVELAHLYRDLLGKGARAYVGNPARDDSPASPFVQFVERTISILETVVIVHKPLTKQVVPSPKTMNRYLENIVSYHEQAETLSKPRKDGPASAEPRLAAVRRRFRSGPD